MISRFGLFVLLPVVAVLGVLAVPLPASAAGGDGVVPQHDQPKTYRPEARIVEKIGTTVPMDVTFRDENDQPITLGEAIGNKPTILVPVYYRCPMLCTKVLNGVLEACRQMPKNFSIGEQFNVVTVSMDPKEHSDLARPKKKAYVDEYGRPGAENGWRFLTGTKENIATLLDSVGFFFEFDKMLKEYNHPSGVIILSPQGKVTRYFHGIGYDGEFETPEESKAWAAGQKPELTDSELRERKAGERQFTRPTTTLRLSLIEANGGYGGSLLDQITMLCYRYDALHQGYSLQVIWVVRIAGLITLLLVCGWVALAVRREGLLGNLMVYSSIFVLIFGWVSGMFALLMLSRTMSLTTFAALFATGVLVGLGGLRLLYRRRLARPAELAPVTGAPAEPTGGTA